MDQIATLSRAGLMGPGHARKLEQAFGRASVETASIRASLKALNTENVQAIFLSEAGRSGEFVWRTGNFNTQIAADTTEAIFIKADAIAATAGAWVRVFDGNYINPEWTGRNLQAAVDLAAVLGIRTIPLQGSYTLSAALNLRPDVVLWCMPGAATVSRPSGASFGQTINWATHTAHRAGIEGLIVDGGRTATNSNVGHATLSAVGAINDPFVKNCQVLNNTGHGMLFQNTRRPVITDNRVDNCFVSGIYVYGTSVTDEIDALIRDNRVSKFGQHGIVTWNVQGSRVLDNVCIGYSQRTNVNISGTTITVASGTNFANVSPGEFVIGIPSGGAYFEALIVSKQSNTQLTIASAIPGTSSASNVPCVIGNGDVISISGSRDELVEGNTVRGGACLGISLFSTADSSCDRCRVIGNTVMGTMASGYSLQVAHASYFVRDNLFLGNFAIETGQGGAAMDANYRSGMTVQAGNNGLRNVIDDNSWINYGSQMAEGLRVTGSTGGVQVGQNKTAGLDPAIVGGATVSLTSGWGSSTVSSVECFGDVIHVAINASGASANPSFTVNHTALPIRRKAPSCQMTGSPGNFLGVVTFSPDPDNSSVFTVLGTPSNGVNRFTVRL